MKPTMNANPGKRDIEELADDEIITMQDVIKYMDEKDKMKKFRQSITVEQKKSLKVKTDNYEKRVKAEQADEKRKIEYLNAMDDLEER